MTATLLKLHNGYLPFSGGSQCALLFVFLGCKHFQDIIFEDVQEITEGVHENEGKSFGICCVICWREAGGDEVWTWKGVILLALSHWASGRCCTAHCIFQLQFQPSDHCKPLCDLISLEDPCSWASSFAPKISGKMERTWLWRRVRHPTRIHIILKSAQATTLCLLSEEDDRFITTMLIQLNYRFHQPRPACG